MPSHVAGKTDNSRGTVDQAGLPGVCLILPLHKEEARLLFFFFSVLLQVVQEETHWGRLALVPNLICRITVGVWFWRGPRFLSD